MYFFAIPDSDIVRKQNFILLEGLKSHKDWFFDDFIIYTAYGTPPHCIWNGGRAMDDEHIELDDWLDDVLKNYLAHGVQYRLTFTNFLLKPEHLFDAYCNQIAKMHNEFGGYVMVTLPLMAEYMKNYPNLKVCWSTSTDFGANLTEQIETVNVLSENCLVVPYYMWNSNKDVLWHLKHPQNIEVLVDEKCINNCPRRHEHEANANRYNLYLSDVYPVCLMEPQCDFSEPRIHRIERPRLAEYAEHGINHFKIEGRKDEEVGKEYVKYFVRPEHYIDYLRFSAAHSES